MVFTYKKMINLNEDTNSLFKIILYERRRKSINECPHCKSKAFIRYGKYSGIQRYKCKKCKKTFSLTTNSIWYYSKKKVDTWTNYIEMMLEKKSLRFIASKLKISLATGFYWRHKLMDAMCENNKVEKLNDYVHILTERIAENYKGSRGVHNEEGHLWIVTAKGGNDKIISEPISKNMWSSKSFNEKIYCKIDKKSFIKAYQNRYVYVLAKKHNSNVDGCQADIKDKSVENYMHMYYRWFAGFRGIATKYIKEYLNWYMMFYREKKYYCFGYIREIVKVKKYIRTYEIGKLE